MNTKYVIIIVVVILAIYGAFSLGKKPAVAPEAPGDSQTKSNTIPN